MSPNFLNSQKWVQEDDEVYHSQVKVQPVSWSLRKRKQVKYVDEDESLDEVMVETFHESFEEPSIPANSKNFCEISKNKRKTSDMTDLTDNEELKITPIKLRDPQKSSSPMVNEESLRKLRLLWEASCLM